MEGISFVIRFALRRLTASLESLFQVFVQDEIDNRLRDTEIRSTDSFIEAGDTLRRRAEKKKSIISMAASDNKQIVKFQQHHLSMPQLVLLVLTHFMPKRKGQHERNASVDIAMDSQCLWQAVGQLFLQSLLRSLS